MLRGRVPMRLLMSTSVVWGTGVMKAGNPTAGVPRTGSGGWAERKKSSMAGCLYAFEGGGNAGLRSGCPREGRRGSAGSSPAWDLGASARGKGNSEAEGSPYAGLRKKNKAKQNKTNITIPDEGTSHAPFRRLQRSLDGFRHRPSWGILRRCR